MTMSHLKKTGSEWLPWLSQVLDVVLKAINLAHVLKKFLA
jgi:hypothetical protein